MPKQNRVTPFGDMIATPARGTLMGNRGVLHNSQGHIVRPYQVSRWIICQLAFKGRRRAVMTPGRYTELFFLDEATALAAGHRPCFECQRAAYKAYGAAWTAVHSHMAPKAGDIDKVLHQERINQKGEKVTFTALLDDLPTGTFVAVAGKPYLIWHETLLPWSLQGYGAPAGKTRRQTVPVLTPRSTVAVMAYGYAPQVHGSAMP